MGFGSGVDISEHRRAELLEERGEIIAKYDAASVGKGREISASRLAGFAYAFAEFQKIARLVSCGKPAFALLTSNRPTAQIPTNVINAKPNKSLFQFWKGANGLSAIRISILQKDYSRGLS